MMIGCRTPQEEEMGGVQDKLPISIYLPVDDTYARTGDGPRRAMGDPGTTELFELPNYIYIFIANEVEDDVWKVWDQITIEGVRNYWHKEFYSGELMGYGDSIYRYTREIIKPLSPGDKFKGRIYAIVSSVKLTFSPPLTNGTSSLNDLLDLTFLTSPDSIQANLQNIYSTPYNYVVGGKYYGSFNSSEHNVPIVDLMLYHVAAKVDVSWFVPEDKRINKDHPENAVRLTYMDACNLFNGDAFCFKPMENSSGTDSLSTGRTVNIVTANDEGLWWEGRSYFYTIPYTCDNHPGYFPLQMDMETNESTQFCHPTMYLEVNTSSPFVPWLRATFNLKNPLTESTPTYTVEQL